MPCRRSSDFGISGCGSFGSLRSRIPMMMSRTPSAMRMSRNPRPTFDSVSTVLPSTKLANNKMDDSTRNAPDR